MAQILKSKGITNEALAEMVQAHPVTISRLINGRRPLTERWLEKFGAALGVDPIEIYTEPSNVRTVTVKAAVQAGVFSESSEWPDHDDWYEVAVPNDPQFAGVEMFGAEVRGPSMNRRYPESSVVVCTAPWSDNEQPEPGKRYIVERRRLDGTVETTVKLLHRDPEGGLWLLAESDDPRFQRPIPIEGDTDGEEIRVIGRVRYAVTRE
ncbi:MAG: LexA family transcriptional regulator [Aurantimonas endophytica]|uniref:LexA family transcriptional regulator n=1 Tax=Aurantimonas endophytica TaxID=1522175 RepID=UPI0030030295